MSGGPRKYYDIVILGGGIVGRAMGAALRIPTNISTTAESYLLTCMPAYRQE